jgi:alpha-beta hydrolase superfamily lysophospholipase
MKRWIVLPIVILLTVVVVALLALALGGPGKPPPMASINSPFQRVDFSDVPAPTLFAARDGTTLAYRGYPAFGRTRGSVVLVHGSSASGGSMHVLAKAFALAGFATYSLDIRGHGASGRKGYIAYIGQLEDDLEDFVHSVQPAGPTTLAGFSSGGGFALRFAGSSRQKLFANYLFLSPFLSQGAPTYRPDSGGWVSVGLPRMIAIALFNALGVHLFDELPVLSFALDDESRKFLTPQYSYALAMNFQPQRDYRANIRAMQQPARLLAGTDDEAFYADRFAQVFKAEGKEVPVTLIPGVGHIPVTLEPAAVQAAVQLVVAMDEGQR